MAVEKDPLLLAGAEARRQGRVGDAAAYYAAALSVAREQGDRLCIAHIARHLGEIHLENGLTDKAGSLLQEAVDLYRSSLDTKVLDLANSLRPLALLHHSLGDYLSAREHWQEAKTLYSAIGVVDGASECDLHLTAGNHVPGGAV